MLFLSILSILENGSEAVAVNFMNFRRFMLFLILMKPAQFFPLYFVFFPGNFIIPLRQRLGQQQDMDNGEQRLILIGHLRFDLLTIIQRKQLQKGSA